MRTLKRIAEERGFKIQKLRNTPTSPNYMFQRDADRIAIEPGG